MAMALGMVASESVAGVVGSRVRCSRRRVGGVARAHTRVSVTCGGSARRGSESAQEEEGSLVLPSSRARAAAVAAMAAALIVAVPAATPQDALAASGGRAGGRSGFSARASRPSSRPSMRGGATMRSAPNVVVAPGYGYGMGFGGYGMGLPGFGGMYFMGGGMFQFFLLMAVLNFVANKLSEATSGGSSDEDGFDDYDDYDSPRR